MEKEDKKALTKRSEDQAKWYTEVVLKAKLADYSPVRGCMVIRPYGYAIWEKIQKILDSKIKDAGVQNAYFPLLIPYSFLEREAEHIEGFAPEVAIVTKAGGKELEEPLVIRPTSETIIYEMFSKWLESYKELPMKINQWANIVRWEKSTNPFLRTTEFLWQEGHTAHSSKEDADNEVLRALKMYSDFVTESLGMYVVSGYKTNKEKFAGAEYTTTVEALMKDGKVLQSATSHMMGQNFAKSFNPQYVDKDGTQQYAYNTSWGLSTRIIGGLIMQHGDDKGLVLPPNIAPVQVMIIPIYRSEDKEKVLGSVREVEAVLKGLSLSYEIDMSENSPGYKFADSELRGIPVRIEIGLRDIENSSVTLVSRVDSAKQQVKMAELKFRLPELLNAIQSKMLANAKAFTEANTKRVASYDEFKELVDSGYVGYIDTYFYDDPNEEERIKEETKYKSSCRPLESWNDTGSCFISGKEGKRTLFAKSY